MNKNISALVIFNLTPDSFSDGGELGSFSNVKEKILNCLATNVKAFDFGACSTAPFNSIISEEEELERFEGLLFPCISLLPDKAGFTYSFDTFYPENIKKILHEFANFSNAKFIWNDVSGVVDGQTIAMLFLNKNLNYVYNFTLLTHKKDISHHRDFIDNDIDILFEMTDAFEKVKRIFHSTGLNNQLIFDPGFGFSKSADQDLKLLKSFLNKELRLLHGQYLIGISRKSFLKKLHDDNLDKKASLLLREAAHLKILIDFFKLDSSTHIYWRLHDSELFNYAKNLSNSLA